MSLLSISASMMVALRCYRKMYPNIGTTSEVLTLNPFRLENNSSNLLKIWPLQECNMLKLVLPNIYPPIYFKTLNALNMYTVHIYCYFFTPSLFLL